MASIWNKEKRLGTRNGLGWVVAGGGGGRQGRLWLRVVAGGNWRGGMEGAIKCLMLYFLSVSNI